MRGFKKYLVVSSYLFLCSCNSGETLKSDFEGVVEKTQKEYQNYSEDNWEKVEKKVEDLTTKFEENRANYTPQQIKDINNLIGKYRALQLKQSINQIKNAIEDFGQQIEGAVKEMTDSTNNGN